MKDKSEKVFDCVELKNRIQHELMEEYEARKGEFESYADFINKTARETELYKRLTEKMEQARRAA